MPVVEGSASEMRTCRDAGSAMRGVAGRRHAYDEDRVGKPLRGGLGRWVLPAVVAAAVVLVASCSSDADGFPLSPVSVRAHGSIDATSEADARGALVAAIDATQADYRYQTTVTVDDAVTTEVVGAVAGDARQSTITSDGRVVKYLQTRYGRWVMGPAHRWMITREDPETSLPLEVLTGPSTVGADVEADGDLVVDATYSGEALGVPGVDEVEVEVVISGGLVSHVRYEVPAGARTAEVVTVISDVGGVGVISAPDLGGQAPTTR
jgi:hypothetical protein